MTPGRVYRPVYGVSVVSDPLQLTWKGSAEKPTSPTAAVRTLKIPVTYSYSYG